MVHWTPGSGQWCARRSVAPWRFELPRHALCSTSIVTPRASATTQRSIGASQDASWRQRRASEVVMVMSEAEARMLVWGGHAHDGGGRGAHDGAIAGERAKPRESSLVPRCSRRKAKPRGGQWYRWRTQSRCPSLRHTTDTTSSSWYPHSERSKGTRRDEEGPSQRGKARRRKSDKTTAGKGGPGGGGRYRGANKSGGLR